MKTNLFRFTLSNGQHVYSAGPSESDAFAKIKKDEPKVAKKIKSSIQVAEGAHV